MGSGSALLFVLLYFLLKQSEAQTRSCPNGFKKFSNHCFVAHMAKSVDRARADKYCRGINAKTVEIRSRAVQDFLRSTYRTTAYFIGIQKDSRRGVWEYSDGRPILFTNWARHEPRGGNRCAIAEPITGQWRTINCAGDRRTLRALIVCEKPYAAHKATTRTPTKGRTRATAAAAKKARTMTPTRKATKKRNPKPPTASRRIKTTTSRSTTRSPEAVTTETPAARCIYKDAFLAAIEKNSDGKIPLLQAFQNACDPHSLPNCDNILYALEEYILRPNCTAPETKETETKSLLRGIEKYVPDVYNAIIGVEVPEANATVEQLMSCTEDVCGSAVEEVINTVDADGINALDKAMFPLCANHSTMCEHAEVGFIVKVAAEIAASEAWTVPPRCLNFLVAFIMVCAGLPEDQMYPCFHTRLHDWPGTLFSFGMCDACLLT